MHRRPASCNVLGYQRQRWIDPTQHLLSNTDEYLLVCSNKYVKFCMVKLTLHYQMPYAKY